MSLTRAVASSVSCHGCRSAIVRSFLSSTFPNRTSWTASVPTPPRRTFTSSVIRRQARDGLSDLEKEAELEEAESAEYERMLEEELNTRDATEPQIQYPITANHPPTEPKVNPVSTPDSETPSAALQNIPWYLRDRVDTPAAQAAQIPDLPPNPPPLLSTLLEYISMTAGLDDLLLLDLRHLDPPPALGPKLIMIIGTARSEKHLHVSADRFCRWLRREHSLRANAAGLLGRNELKIKLRRKAKRMKMLANVGGQEPEGNLDDGIRTGWICCTVGKIEAHPEDMHMPGDDVENFVGFREVKPGVNVVVQMFVEEKRLEIDLETLWGGVVRTHEREVKAADKILEDIDKEDIEGEAKEEQIPPINEEKPEPKPRVQRKSSYLYAPKAPPSPISSHPPSSSIPSAAPPARPKPSVGDPFPDVFGSSPSQLNRPRASAGDPFPPLSDSHSARPRHIRRLHTVGLSG
jgi:hypothetical protein